MGTQSIKQLFATYVYEGKWKEEDIPLPIKESVMAIVAELEKSNDDGGVSENV